MPDIKLRIIATPAPDQEGRELVLVEGETWVGRDDGCDLTIADESMSRRHARFVPMNDGSLMVHDNRSSNGVFYQGERVSEAQVWPGQRFRLGGTELEIVKAQPAAPKVVEGAPQAMDKTEIVALPKPAAPPSDTVEPEQVEPELARLRVVNAGSVDLIGREFPLYKEETWAGRVHGEIVLPEVSMSGKHARLLFDTEKKTLTVQDNNSSNGVFFRAQRVSEATVPAGEKFSLGAATFELIVESVEVDEGSDVWRSGTRFITNLADIVDQFESPVALEDQGEEIVTAANQPFLLSDPTKMWLVSSGKIEIFTVRVEDGKPVGARTHFLTVEPGQAFFGLDTDHGDLDSGFLAVGKAGSVLRQYEIDLVQLLVNVPAHRERVAKLMETWVSGLARRLTSDVAHIPDIGVPLTVGEEVVLPDDKVIGTMSGVVWLEMPSAHFFYDSMAGLSYGVEGVYFPLSQGAWLELLASDGKIVVTPQRTVDCLLDARIWAGLDAFHRVICECELLNKRLAAADEYLRLEKKAEQIEAAQEEAIGVIGSVMGGSTQWGEGGGSAEVEPVLRACEMVGATLGIAVKSHPNSRVDGSFEETLHDIAVASRFRTRQVKLPERWWKHDQGAFLGQIEESNDPVALLPDGPYNYRLVDPKTGENKKVTAAIAETVAPFAYSFYASFPDGLVTARGLISYGLKNLSGELRTVAMMAIGAGLLSTVTPIITGKVFDTAIPQAEKGLLYQFGLGLFLVAMTTSAFKITQNVAMLRIQGKMDYSIQAAVWDRLMDLPLTFFRQYTAGDLSDRAAGVDKIRTIISGAGLSAILGSVASSFNAVQMLFYDFVLGGVAIVLTLFYVTLTMTCNYIQLRFQRREMWRKGKINGLVLQLISGIAKIRVSGTENHALRTWATEFAGMRRTSFKVGRVQNVLQTINQGYTVFATGVIFFTMVKLKESAAESGETFDLSTGDFLAFNAAFGIFLAAMQALGDASLNMLKIVPIFERLRPILEEPSEVDESKAPPPKIKGAIEISHVKFRYTEDGPWILKDVSIKIEPGQFVALVGGSGSGKSTLMRLMLGFESPDVGSVYYDGVDLSTLDVRMVRQQMGVVLQESRLLPTDIYRNIVGASSLTVADAWAAARKAGIDADIKRMPMGMHTYIMEGGGGFSGGQKQRLMIARAIVHNPKILFLDEATSALDNRTQAIVTESMNKLQATRVVIAHRLSTIQDADCIFYLDHGVVKEKGSYEELMAMDGLFAQLARRQQA